MEFRNQNPEVSVVVPVYNEVPTNLDALLERLHVVFEPSLVFYEVVFVDDGSQELTASYVRGLAQRNLHVRLIVLATSQSSVALAAQVKNMSSYPTNQLIIMV